MSKGWPRLISFFACLCVCLVPACAGKFQPLESYADRQKTKVQEKSAYVQADFDFWAAMYEPTKEDLEALRSAWVEHGQAFPESRPFEEVEREVRKHSQRVVMVALFMTNYENADLLNKSQGWSVYPVPSRITELAGDDQVLRTLFPVRNRWARYFLLRYPPDIWSQATQLIISDRTSRVELRKTR